MKADPRIVEFIRVNMGACAPEQLREQLLKDGVSPEEVEAALAEAAPEPQPEPKNKRTLYVCAGGILLLAMAAYLAKGPSTNPEPGDKGAEVTASGDRLFRGHYGYILKLPPGYEAIKSFSDPQKTREVVHIFPKGTNHTHLIHEGLYGHLGIVRLEVSPRRVPQGVIGLDTLRAWVKSKLAHEKATYTLREQVVHGMPGFIVIVTEPFASAKAYMVGQKVYYTLAGGSEDALFNNLISSLIEAAPTDAPGT